MSLNTHPRWAWTRPVIAPRQPVPCPTCGLCGIAVDVGELVVLAMRRHPVDHRALGRGRSERRERRSREAVALEAAVGQEPVEADGYPGPHRHVEEGQDQEVLPVEEVADPAEPHADRDHDRRHGGDHSARDAVDDRHLTGRTWPADAGVGVDPTLSCSVVVGGRGLIPRAPRVHASDLTSGAARLPGRATCSSDAMLLIATDACSITDGRSE